MDRPRRLLILGGTAEASALARRLAGDASWEVTYSLAGRTASPVLPPGGARVGGFGGAAGLAAWLRSASVDVVVDATHPFAAVMRWNTASACEEVGLPRLRLERPGFVPVAGDRWRRVASVAAAAEVVASSSWRSVLVTTGRQELAAFVPASDGVRRWVVRSVDPPADLALSPVEVVLGRGPFAYADELALQEAHGVDVVVTKDSGGPGAKLEAARARAIEVVVVDRPPSPDGPEVATVGAALAWLDAQVRRRRCHDGAR